MSAKAPEKIGVVSQLRAVFAHRWMAGLIVLAALVAGSYALWTTVAPHLAGHPHYRLDLQQITITPKPDWIRADVRAEAIRDGGLDGSLSILDGNLAERVAKAFSLHPWVARVVEVRKVSPPGLDVCLEYRRPVCMVEIPGGLYAVDEHAMLLPSSDFSPLEACRYPRLSGIQTVTEGPVGTRWEDARVQGAAQIAAILVDAWNDLRLIKIVPTGEVDPIYDLYTAQGGRVIWGHPPTLSEGEPSATDKLSRLKAHLTSRPPAVAPGAVELDLRQAMTRPVPRTAEVNAEKR